MSQAVWEFYDKQLDALEERCSSPDYQRYWWRPFANWQQQQRQRVYSDTAVAGGDDGLDVQEGRTSPFAVRSRSSFFSFIPWLWLSRRLSGVLEKHHHEEEVGVLPETLEVKVKGSSSSASLHAASAAAAAAAAVSPVVAATDVLTPVMNGSSGGFGGCSAGAGVLDGPFAGPSSAAAAAATAATAGSDDLARSSKRRGTAGAVFPTPGGSLGRSSGSPQAVSGGLGRSSKELETPSTGGKKRLWKSISILPNRCGGRGLEVLHYAVLYFQLMRHGGFGMDCEVMMWALE